MIETFHFESMSLQFRFRQNLFAWNGCNFIGGSKYVRSSLDERQSFKQRQLIILA